MTKRGRLLFLTLALLIVLSEGTNLFLVLTSGTAGRAWLRSIVVPLIMIWSIWNLWNTGDPWTRIGLGVMTFLKGITELSLFAWIMFRLAEVTPRSEAAFFWEMSGLMFTVPTLCAMAYVVTGVVLWFSPSLKAFLNSRRVGEEATGL